ncbi:hypothetical protein [Niallia sp. NCCP-28]|uniref:hypothetical protein n=1 Tax=Niallia sp. NCCP-28 TaxID=2934712 RepID=UPI002080D186|nr:hypothetical protein [Niallia sp. NCCP-28]GKU82581.1 hypothetical protein NCCP28_19770 [Niallia sp. NCCP-28]
MKKFISLLFSLSVVFLIYTTKEALASELTNVNGLNFSDEEIQNLQSLGFTDEAIINMDEEEYNLNKDLKGDIVAEDTKYIKVIENPEELNSSTLSKNTKGLNTTEINGSIVIELDEETFYKELEAEEQKMNLKASSSVIQTSYKKLTTSISKLSTNKYRITNNMTWKKLPSTREYDVTGIGINSTYWAPVPDSQYGKQTWTKYSHMYGTESGNATYNTSSANYKKGAGGYSLKMNLPNDSIGGGAAHKTVKTMSNYMYYSVSPLSKSGQLDAYGHYTHQNKSGTYSIGISLGGPSFSVSPSNKFDSAISTHAQVKF